eukprot:TRINITY_DN23883_c0_g1_i1.p2 TRINITY_DN23883_c0_g1~~TRINITY_DN23883_c0_g1_i1.p2  ORF type:complete len:565 (+),score=285.70 TRINITY_DN23883_c0_g1_i1:105-1799(+)
MDSVQQCDEVRRDCDKAKRLSEENDHQVAAHERALRDIGDDDDARARAEGDLLRVLNEKADKMMWQMEKLAQVSTTFQEIRKQVSTMQHENADQEQQVRSMQKAAKQLKNDNDELQAQRDGCIRQLQEVQEKLRIAEQEQRKVRSEAELYPELAAGGAAAQHYDAGDASRFWEFTQRRDDLVEQLERLSVLLQWYNSAGAQDAKRSFDLAGESTEALQGHIQALSADSVVVAGAENVELGPLREQAEAVQQEARGLSGSAWAAELGADSCAELWRAVEKAKDDWLAICQAEVKRRGDKSAAVDRFMQDDAKLLQWCRQERSNLEALQEASHQQEFCASLLQNISTMDDNFQHLYQMGTPLLPDREVEKALVEVNEVWLFLQLYAYELQMRLMYEIHPTAKLEDEVREFAGWTAKLQTFLAGGSGSLKETLNLPAISGDTHTYRQRCRELINDLNTFSALPQQLADFAGRMEGIRANYRSFRQHVLGRLTFLSDLDSRAEDRAAARRQEYAEKTAEIRSWDQGQQGGESWKALHEKVLGLKQLLQRQIAACKAAAPAEAEGQEDF